MAVVSAREVQAAYAMAGHRGDCRRGGGCWWTRRLAILAGAGGESRPLRCGERPRSRCDDDRLHRRACCPAARLYRHGDNGRVSTIVDASTPRYYIWVTRDDGSSAIRPRTSAQAVEEFLNRHFDQLGAEFLRSLQRAQWTSNGLDGASIRASRTGVPGYLALVGCRGLRWEVATSFSEVFDTADAIAHSLQEAGPSTRA